MNKPIKKLNVVLIIILTNLLICSSIIAQSPLKMSYQAVIRNSSNALVVSHTVGMRISILQGSVTGTEVYSETQTPTTNANGLVSIEIGNGAGFSTINWATGPYFIKTETDPTGGTNYTITGTSQLLAVPYSLNAKTAETADYNNLTNLPTLNIANWNTAYGWGNHANAGYLTSYTETDPVFSAHLSSHITGADTANWNHKYALPILNIGSILFSNGTTIAQDNNLFWDNINKRLGIGTNVPSASIEFKSNLTNQNQSFVKVVNSNGDSVLTISGNGTDIIIDSTSGNFSVSQSSANGKKGILKLNSSNSFIGYNAGVSNTTGFANVFLGHNSGYNNQTGEDNVYIGSNTGFSGTNSKRNIFIGDSVGYLSNSQYVTNNVFIGYAAGKNCQAFKNVFIGNLAGWNSRNGYCNIAIGNNAGFSNNGYHNIFIGTDAGGDNIGGIYNIMLGHYAGHYATNSRQEILIGESAGYNDIYGENNIMIGTNAGTVNSSGTYNIYIGASAGRSNTGSRNVLIGTNVGYSSFQNVSDRLIIDSYGGLQPLIWGEFDNRKLVIRGTNSDNINNRTFFVNGSAGGTGGWWNDSDEKLKKNIKTIEDPLKKVLALRGVNYEWKDTTNHEKGIQIGFIAQEVIKILPEVVSNNSNFYAMQYAPITALLVEAIKEQQKKIENLELMNDKYKELEEQNEKLKKDLENFENLQNQIDALKEQIQLLKNNSNK